MPNFVPSEMYISPRDYIESCEPAELKKLVQILLHDNLITSEQIKESVNFELESTDTKELIYLLSLENLKKYRSSLTTTEEQFIINLSERFKD